MTVQYGDNASDRNTAARTSGAVQANVPRTPTGLRSTPGAGRVSLAWTAPNDCGSTITGYSYRYRKVSGSAWLGSGTTTGPAVEITGLESDVAYRFEIKAVNAQGESAAATQDETPVANRGRITLSPNPPRTCAHVEATLTDADGGINTEFSDSPPGFPYGWSWIPQTSPTPSATTTTQSYLPGNSLVGQTIRVTVQYGDNASNRNTAARTSGAVQANAPRAIPRFTATGGQGRVDLSWSAPNDCGASVTYTYKYRRSGNSWTTRTTTSTSAAIAPLDAGPYAFELTAGNRAGTSGPETATATVTAVNRSPIVTGPANPVTVPENSRTVGPYTGTDPDGDRLTWTTGSGFSVSPTSGPSGGSTTLAFDEAPNYEVDATSYSVRVQATDPHGASHSYSVTIAIGNEDDPGVVTISPSRLLVGEDATASLRDEDGGVSAGSWSWRTSATGRSGTAASSDTEVGEDAPPRVGQIYLVRSRDVGRYLKATRDNYNDHHGSGKQATGFSAGPVRPNVPTAPGNVRAVRGDGRVSLRWSVPSDDRGADITGYEYGHKIDGGRWSDPESTTSLSATITGLTNGSLYHFQVRARNSAGPSDYATDSGTPAGRPDAPSGFRHVRGSQTSVQVLWDEPEDHGSTITEYLWSWKPGIFWDSESSVASTDFVHSSSPAYQDNEYRVRARNGAGLGPYGNYTVPREEFRSPRSKPVADFADSTGFGVLTAPNPFNAQTRIHLALPEDMEVTLTVHSVTGQTVARLYDHTPLEAGLHTLEWRGVDDRGRPVGSGIYLVRVIAGDRVHVGKLVLIR